MRWSMGKLHVQWEYPKFDVEKAVGKYLMELDQCASQVLIMSPEYGEKGWLGDVVADSASLKTYANSRSEGFGYCYPYYLYAAAFALQLWLRGADNSNDSISRIPKEFAEVLKHNISDLIEKQIASIVCKKCNTIFCDANIIKKGEHESPSLFWIDEWRCPEGHLLRYEKGEIPMFSMVEIHNGLGL